MKKRMQIGTFLRQYTPASLYTKMLDICPDQKTPHGFDCSLLEDDPRLIQILQLLEEYGYKPWGRSGRLNYANEYRVEVLCEYSPEELTASPWVAAAISIEGREEQIAFARDKRKDTYRGPWWEVKKMSKWKLMEVPSTGSDVEGFFAVPQRMRNAIEKAELRGAMFSPMKIHATEQEDMDEQGADAVDDAEIKGPWWRLKLAQGPVCHAGPPTEGLVFNAPVRVYDGELDDFQNSDFLLGQLPSTRDAYYLLLTARAFALFTKEKVAATYTLVLKEPHS